MKRPCSLALPALLALAAGTAPAANLIVNGDFDANVDHWNSDESLTSFWFDTFLDADGSSTSG